MVVTEEDRRGMRWEASAATYPWKDNSGAIFERWPSSCLKGNSPESQTGSSYKDTYPMPRVSPLPFKGPLSFCLCSGSCQLSFPLCILWEHSSLQLPAFCHGIFLSSNPVRFVISSAYLMMAQFSGILQDSCCQSWQSIYTMNTGKCHKYPCLESPQHRWQSHGQRGQRIESLLVQYLDRIGLNRSS